MKRYRETDILNFFTKRKQVSDDGNGTEEVCAADNSIDVTAVLLAKRM